MEQQYIYGLIGLAIFAGLAFAIYRANKGEREDTTGTGTPGVGGGGGGGGSHINED